MQELPLTGGGRSRGATSTKELGEAHSRYHVKRDQPPARDVAPGGTEMRPSWPPSALGPGPHVNVASRMRTLLPTGRPHTRSSGQKCP